MANPDSAQLPVRQRALEDGKIVYMLDMLSPVDLVVMGCVAVGEDGARLGKGAASPTLSTPWPRRRA